MFNFERIEVWHRSVALAGSVYELTRRFSADERFGLTNQMRRAVVSISSNLAEGCSRHSKADFSRFIELATGSAFELGSQVKIAAGQGFLTGKDHDQLYASILEVVRMLTGLRNSLRE
jgi:four helix bundle protein